MLGRELGQVCGDKLLLAAAAAGGDRDDRIVRVATAALVEARKPRSAVPLFEMGEPGRLQSKEWEAGWDQRDYELKLGVAA